MQVGRCKHHLVAILIVDVHGSSTAAVPKLLTGMALLQQTAWSEAVRNANGGEANQC